MTPLKIGNTIFPHALIQGPLAGISCAPFRLLTWRYSQPAFSYTEMISCKTILHHPAQALTRYLAKDPQEGPVCFQLSGNDPIELAAAVKKVTAHGADLIDLNCGCPVKKIRSKGAGSRLLTNTAHLYDLMSAMKQSTHLPVSIKIRVQGDSDEKTNAAIVEVVKESGIDFLTVHGRHWTEHYETPCRHDEIAFFTQALSIPVIGNGDVACPTTLEAMLDTGCAGVMIGRAGVGQPWLIKQLLATLEKKSFQAPDVTLRGKLFLEHVRGLARLLQNEFFAILQARTFAKYYARKQPFQKPFSEAVNRCTTIIELEKIIEQFFQ